jgi:hypothetical protein
MDAGISLGIYNLSMLRRVGRRSVHEGCVVLEGGGGIGFFCPIFFWGFPLSVPFCWGSIFIYHLGMHNMICPLEPADGHMPFT